MRSFSVKAHLEGERVVEKDVTAPLAESSLVADYGLVAQGSPCGWEREMRCVWTANAPPCPRGNDTIMRDGGRHARACESRCY